MTTEEMRAVYSQGDPAGVEEFDRWLETVVTDAYNEGHRCGYDDGYGAGYDEGYTDGGSNTDDY